VPAAGGSSERVAARSVGIQRWRRAVAGTTAGSEKLCFAFLFSFTGDPLDSNNEREGIEKAGQAEVGAAVALHFPTLHCGGGDSRRAPAPRRRRRRRRPATATGPSNHRSPARPSCGVSLGLGFVLLLWQVGRLPSLAAREIKRPAAVYALEIRRASTPIPWVGQCGTGRTHGLTPRAM
jgi:hypothetical protein